MKIRGSGSGFFGFGGGGSRSDSFRHGRRPGQKLRGTLLKWVSEDMAWVSIDGHKLLAQLNSKPPVGALLTFIIKQLRPEIVLKEIFTPTTAGANALTLATDFENARTLFENQLRGSANALGSLPASQRRPAFIEALTNPKLLVAYMDVSNCLSAINIALDSDKQGKLAYTPWLIPAGRRHISLFRPKDSELTESIVEFELSDFGMIRAEFLFKQPDIGYRLKLQHASRSDELKRYLTSRYPSDHSGKIECLGISQLPNSAHGGILAELMFRR